MECGDDTVEFKTNPRTPPFNHFGAQRDNQRFHLTPSQTARGWLRKVRFERDLMRVAHLFDDIIKRYHLPSLDCDSPGSRGWLADRPISQPSDELTGASAKTG